VLLAAAVAAYAPPHPEAPASRPDPVNGVTIRGTTVTVERSNMLLDRLMASPEGAAAQSALSGLMESGLAGLVPSGDPSGGAAGGALGSLADQARQALGSLTGQTSDAADEVASSGGEKTTTEDFVLHVAGARFRMDQGSHSMIVLADGGSGVQYWFVDHDARKIWGMHAAAAAEAGRVTGSSHEGMQVTPGSSPETILGHATKHYTFDFETRSEALGPMGGSQAEGASMGVVARNRGDAWIADGIEGADEVSAFYRSFADGLSGIESAGGLQAGLVAGMADLADLGMPLKVIQETEVRLVSGAELGGEDQPMAWSKATTTVSDISRGELDDELFRVDVGDLADYERSTMPGFAGSASAGAVGGGASGQAATGQVEEGCDCSCSAYAELQEMSRDKKAAESNPRAMKLAMCARECAMKWVACARRSP
jgi:hypothetical protein